MTVLGSRQDQIEVVSKFNTFCSICTRRIYENEPCLSWSGKQFFLHLNCELVKDRITKLAFIKEGKRRKPRKTR